MPLWHCYARSLAYRPASRSINPSTSHQKRWYTVHLRQGSSVALNEVQKDETSKEPSHEAFNDELDRVDLGPAHKSESRLRENSDEPSEPERSHHGIYFGRERRARMLARRDESAGSIPVVKYVGHNEVRASKIRQDRFLGTTAAPADSFIRPKFMSVESAGRPSARFSSAWNKGIAQIGRIYDRMTAGDEFLKVARVPTLDTRAAEWAEEVLDQLDDEFQEFDLEGFLKRTNEPYHFVWLQVALWLLAYEKDRVVQFLLATHKYPYPPADYVQDSIHHLAQHYAYSTAPDKVSQLEELADAFLVLCQRKTGERLRILYPTFRYFMEHCEDTTICELYQSATKQQVEMHWFTYCQFTSYFADYGHFELALDALKAARNAGAFVSNFRFVQTCAAVLRKSVEQPGGLRFCMTVLDSLVNMGVRINGPIRDIIMLNAVEAGDLQTAFSVHYSMAAEGLEPTESTFAILLKGCKINIDDGDTLNQTIRNAISNVSVRQSELIANEIIHCLALHHAKHSPEKAFSTLSESYVELFDVGPLDKLGLPVSEFARRVKFVGTPMQPSRHVIIIMVRAYVQHLITTRQDVKKIWPIYNRWRELVEAGEEPFAALANSDHLANAFLIGFISSEETLLHAAQVLRAMQRPLPSTAAGVEQCKPSVQTWSIFLHGFTRHGQLDLAKQVMRYMQADGIIPDHVTWTTLVHGYARAQDVDGVLDSLRGLERAGYAWNDWTRGSLKVLRDKSKLQEEFGRLGPPPDLDFTEELRRGLGRRLGSPGEDGKSSVDVV